MNPRAAQAFDAYRESYRATVQDSVGFSGLNYDYFLRSKARLLRMVLAKALGPDRAPDLLDIGCGVGALHPLLGPFCGALNGVDVSAPCIDQARQDNPEVRYDVYDGGRLPYPDAAFDVVLTVCVLHHVPPAERAAFAGEMARVLRPGGVGCVIEHNPLNPLTRLSVMRCPFDADAVLLARRQSEALLTGAGLGQVKSRYFVVAPTMADWALRLEGWLAAAPLGAQYLTVGRR